MVGDDPEAAGAERDQPREPLVHRAHEGDRFGSIRRMLVLHIIGKRQIDQVRPAGFKQANSGIEHEQGKIGGILVRRAAPHQRTDCGDAVLRIGRLVGLLGGESDALEPSDRAPCAACPWP